MNVSEKDRVKCLEGYFLQDCAIVNETTLAFVLRSFADTARYSSLAEQKVRKKVLWLERNDAGETDVNCITLEHSEELYVAAAHSEGDECVWVNSTGLVAGYSNKEFYRETRVEDCIGIPSERMRGFVVKSICGRPFIAGAGGLAAMRRKRDAWTHLPVNAPQGVDASIVDIDGFALDDLYAVSLHGNVFHYDGTQWEQMSFPSNIPLDAICCGKDGRVYICGRGGAIFQGRLHAWQRINEGGLRLPFADMVWYDGAVWCANDHGLWIIRDATLERQELSMLVSSFAGHLSAHGNLLLMGGLYGATLYDGTAWKRIFFTDPPEEEDSEDDGYGGQ